MVEYRRTHDDMEQLRLSHLSAHVERADWTANDLAELARISFLGFTESVQRDHDAQAAEFEDLGHRFVEMLDKSPAVQSAMVFAEMGILEFGQVAA